MIDLGKELDGYNESHDKPSTQPNSDAGLSITTPMTGSGGRGSISYGQYARLEDLQAQGFNMIPPPNWDDPSGDVVS